MHAQRQQDVQQERARLAARRLEHRRLIVGNLYNMRPAWDGSANVHDWTFFVRMDMPEEEVEEEEEDARFIDHVLADVSFRREWDQGGFQEVEVELERQPGPSQAPLPGVASAAEPESSTGAPAAGPGAAAAAQEAGGSGGDQTWEDEDEDQDQDDDSEGDEGSMEEDPAGCSADNAEGGYELRRFLGLSTSSGTSASKGDGAAYDSAGTGGSMTTDGADS
ncbi:hypothetical protein ABPG77_011362 [Micractinium sp. CCAP 211/92]